MLNRIVRYSYLVLITVVVATGCKKLDDINLNPNKPTTSDPNYLITGAEKSTMDILYSTLQNGYFGMHYAQYWSGNSRTGDSQYAIDEGNNSALWNTLYRSIFNLQQIEVLNSQKANPAAKNQNAISKILKVWMFQILTDTYVDVPYSDAFKLETNITPKYDDAKAIYASLVDTLTAQVNALDEAEPTFGNSEIIYKGDVLAWKKLGHSLLLRLAIRMADADPQKAQSIIEANYQQAMTSNADDALFTYVNAAPNKFPMNDSEREITDFFVSQTLVDYMKSVNDPRLNIYVRPSQAGTITGMPYGYAASDTTRPAIRNYSYPGTKIYSPEMDGILMNYSEVEFILAEAAARGWSVGDAAMHYENGIKASMAYWGVTTGIDEYITTVPYNQADWKNVIGTQKWLALYPQGFQAWFERIRLDFKKPGGDSLFVAPHNGSLDANVKFVPTRLTYPTGEQTQNKASYDAAVSKLNGDTKAIKNWWMNF
jgi:hypothetical protein